MDRRCGGGGDAGRGSKKRRLQRVLELNRRLNQINIEFRERSGRGAEQADDMEMMHVMCLEVKG